LLRAAQGWNQGLDWAASLSETQSSFRLLAENSLLVVVELRPTTCPLHRKLHWGYFLLLDRGQGSFLDSLWSLGLFKLST